MLINSSISEHPENQKDFLGTKGINGEISMSFGITVKVLLKGDVNGNCKVDIFDLAAVGKAYGKVY